MSIVRIYTDGACLGNPGPGGWAALIIANEGEQELSGGARHTTNNRMEMIAAIKGLRAVDSQSVVDLYTDSKYLYDGITSYIHNWRQSGWKTSSKNPVKNSDLWFKLDELSQSRLIHWHWVKAHSGHVENERVDKLAREKALTFHDQLENENGQ